MSFGVAFALPAFENPLSTGLNPFTQSGPTLDLLFTGLPTVDNTFVGSSLTLNFLTQQYQLPAQYSVWVADQGLTAKTFSDIITFTRASTGTYVDSNCLVQTAAIDAPRFDYNPSTPSTPTLLGFLVEEARTNLLPESNAFNSTWTATNAVINFNDPYPSPDAFSSSVLFIQPVAAGTAALSYSLTKAATATQYSQSIWINNEFGVAVPAFSLSLDDGTTTNRGVAVFSISSVGAGVLVSATSEGNFSGTSATITHYISNWHRITLTTTSNTATTVRFRCFYTATIASPIVYVWGAQLEVGAFPTSFIYTDGGAVTRAADVASINTLSPWYNPAEGTLIAKINVVNLPTPTQPIAASFNDTTASNRWTTGLTTDGRGAMLRNTGGAGLVQTNTVNAASIGDNNVAVSISSGASVILNGGAVASSPTYAAPTVTQADLGQQLSASYLNGHLQRITYYPRRMANYELQALTV
jgi:hypothetical protein